MGEFCIGPLAEEEIAETVALWERCGLTRPWNDPAADIAMALRSEHAVILAGRFEGRLIATAMVGEDGHRGALYYLAVDPAHRRLGLGRALMDAAEEWLGARGVPKLNLMVRPENRGVVAFYEALGYAVEERVVLAKRLR